MFFQVSGNAVITSIVGGTGTLVGALYGSVRPDGAEVGRRHATPTTTRS